MTINPCNHCSNDPKLKSKQVSAGHGVNVTEFWIECSCGIRTISFDTYGQTDAVCKRHVTYIWNQKR